MFQLVSCSQNEKSIAEFSPARLSETLSNVVFLSPLPYLLAARPNQWNEEVQKTKRRGTETINAPHTGIASNQQPSIIGPATLEFLNVIFLFYLHSLYDRNFCPLPPPLPRSCSCPPIPFPSTPPLSISFSSSSSTRSPASSWSTFARPILSLVFPFRLLERAVRARVCELS